jgi:hypothetical protein
MMNSHWWEKTIVISMILGTAGILACVAAIFNIDVPKGSLTAFLAAIIPLGLAIIGILVGFTWVCDKCNDYFKRRSNRLHQSIAKRKKVKWI